MTGTSLLVRMNADWVVEHTHNQEIAVLVPPAIATEENITYFQDSPKKLM